MTASLTKIFRHSKTFESSAPCVRLIVVFGDDASRLRKGHSTAVMTSIRHLCMNQFQQESSKLSLAKKRRKAAWINVYRAKVMFSA